VNQESPFITTNRVISEPSASSDVVRIIAGELRGEDKKSLLAAADEMEMLHRVLLLTSLELIEARQKLIAVGDQLIAARKAALPSAHYSMSGTFRVVPNQ
jgi:hypothetical protein